MSKENILRRIRELALPATPLPRFPEAGTFDASLLEAFSSKLKAIGGEVSFLKHKEDWENDIKALYPSAKIFASPFAQQGLIQLPIDAQSIPSSLKEVDIAIVEAQFGVAENAAIWLAETDMGNRVLPFICQHLVILLNKEKLLANMHAAYQHIQLADSGFGVFIAGPSKTADIEQSLVIGAQGARTCRVMVY